MVFPKASAPIHESGVIAVGGDFDPEVLIEAYGKGIFPWPQPERPLMWFSPDPRGILDFNDIHRPRSLEKFIRNKSNWTFTINQNFAGVMRACRQQVRPGQSGTWILPEMEPSYFELHRRGLALSFEVWEGSELVGGIYGVWVNHFFSGESMFHSRTNASKMAFLHCVEYLKGQGQTWMDLQMVTSVVESLGAKYISRQEFLARRGLA